MPNGNTVKHGWILLCMCTPLYNETLRGCFTVGGTEKNIKKECIENRNYGGIIEKRTQHLVI